MPTRDRDGFTQKLRDAGMRVTDARIATLELMSLTKSPLTHADVAKHLAEMGVNQATAFRNLNALTEAGFLRRTELGDHVWRFEIIRDGEQDHLAHPHFLCVDCGTVSCLPEVELIQKHFETNGETREVTEILLRGHCRECD